MSYRAIFHIDSLRVANMETSTHQTGFLTQQMKAPQVLHIDCIRVESDNTAIHPMSFS